MRYLSVIIGIGLCGGTFAQGLVIHDPNVVERKVKGYHAISVSNAIDLFLSQGGEEAVAVSAADVKWRDRIKTEVENGVLKIFLDQRGWIWGGGNKRMRVYVSFDTLDKLTASGACDIYVEGVIRGGSLVIDLSGASDFKGAVQLNGLTVYQSGASDTHFSGVVKGVTAVELSGASNLKGYDLETDQCVAYASGVSNVRITVNKELRAHASGASGVYYKGEPVVREARARGASSVSKKG